MAEKDSPLSNFNIFRLETLENGVFSTIATVEVITGK
jgi:hypothetical protein